MDMDYEVAKLKEKAWMWLAWHLPKTLVMWAAVRLMSAATTGKYSNQIVGELTCVDALGRWE